MGRLKKDKSIVQNQRVRSRFKDNKNYFDYDEWRNEQGRYDSTGVADPDLLGNSINEPLAQLEREEIEQECKNKVNVLMRKAKEVLTDKEHEVFLLIGVQFLSLSKTASLLSKKYNVSISKWAVRDSWDRVREKLQKVYFI